ncbi:MAG: hypothetical protein FJW37_13185 [Acidobacteria bacterium]|uniref:Uncharacterized protein n=1 Tax=Candidatus Tanganyikabacteria bacterium TaxID=2961651 RepID=A0A938BK83_9BACT|nr:hypothetical protein [Candidatus Tanganyikabacteria bacterium]MBM3776097.1 hypothetical protein [Acidobacteriota bacterium]
MRIFNSMLLGALALTGCGTGTIASPATPARAQTQSAAQKPIAHPLKNWFITTAAIGVAGAFDTYRITGSTGEGQPFKLEISVGQPNTRLTGQFMAYHNGQFVSQHDQATFARRLFDAYLARPVDYQIVAAAARALALGGLAWRR